MELNNISNININTIEDSFLKFKNCYKGTSYTNAVKLLNKLTEYLPKTNDTDNISFTQPINLNTYNNLIEGLEGLAYSQSVYGIEESLEMLRELKRCTMNIEDDLKEELTMWYHIYICSVATEFDLDKIIVESNDMAHFIDDIYKAYSDDNTTAIGTYKQKISEYLDGKDKDLISNFEEIFDTNNIPTEDNHA